MQCAKIGVQSFGGGRLPKTNLASVVLGTLPSGEVLVTQRQTRLGVKGGYQGMWVFPGGKVDIGETAEEGAMREFEEETGLRLIPGSIRAIALWQAVDPPNAKTYLMLCYTGIIAGHDEPASALKALRMQPDEVSQGAFVPLEIWPRLLPERVRGAIKNLPQSQKAHPILDAIRVSPERNAKGRPVYLKSDVTAQEIADGIGGGHQFALFQLGMSHGTQFEYNFLRGSGDSASPRLAPQ